MFKKTLIGIALGLAIVTVGIYVWGRSVLGRDAVRHAVAAQMSQALGQPVTLGGIRASVFPRVAVTFTDVAIGNPVHVEARELHLEAALRALLSRRIEDARVRLTGARVHLPLPAFTLGGSSSDGSATREAGGAKPPLEVISVRDVVFEDVEILSGGRSVRGNVTLVPGADGVEIRKADLAADGETLSVTGRITDLAGPAGEVTVTATSLAFDRLLVFAMDFARPVAAESSTPAKPEGSAPSSPSVPTPSASVPPAPTSSTPTVTTGTMNLIVNLQADRVTFGTLALEALSGRTHITPSLVTVSPVRFGVFGGRYDGALTFTLERDPAFRINAAVTDVDVGSVLTFLDGGDAISGTLSGHVDIHGRGLHPAAIERSAVGTTRVDVRNGVVKRLGLVSRVVRAGSMRANADLDVSSGTRMPDEPFSNMSATFVVGNGRILTDDLQFRSDSLDLSASGSVALNGQTISLVGDVRLSEALTRDAGRDLVRYTQKDGRVTVPISIDGTLDAPRVRIDLAKATERAIVNRANEELKQQLREGFGRVFGR
jgi:uncharacterized protein involved in outer membrane biogenesis